MYKFKCKQCGKCCSNILPLTDDEIKVIKKIAKKENKRVLQQNWYYVCPFLNNQNKCDIYENRPNICRFYDCYKFENKIFNKEIIKSIKVNRYRVVNLRKEIFESEE